MSDERITSTEEPDPNESPFRHMAIEGLPYKKGSEEDLAVKRVIRKYEEARAAERRAAEGAAGGVRSGRARTAEKLVDLVPRLLGLGRRGRR